MVVEALNIDTKKLACSEKNILQNLECWFGKPPDFNLTWEEYLKAFVISMEEAKNKCELIGKHSKKITIRTKQLLAASIYRPNRDISPPLCILCLNASEDADVMGGVLRWVPKFPSFFAVHEMCMFFIPEISCVKEPTALGAQMSDISLLELSSVFIKRGRRLKCTLCSQTGAMLGCHVRECRSSFHLPCAIRAGCYLNYVEYQCLCPRHLNTAFLDYRNYVYDQVAKIGNAVEEMKDLQVSQEQTCGICLDNVKNRIELNEVVMSICCSAKFYHFECIKKDAINRGSEFRCPTCNRPNEETNFDAIMKIQGVCVHFYHPSYTMDAENSTQHTECYYSDSRRRAKDKKCSCPFGSKSYDDDDAMNDEVFNPWEALNGCTMCGINCHRMCAGSPWSKYTFDGEGEEPAWQCDDCRGGADTSLSPEIITITPQSTVIHSKKHLSLRRWRLASSDSISLFLKDVGQKQSMHRICRNKSDDQKCGETSGIIKETRIAGENIYESMEVNSRHSTRLILLRDAKFVPSRSKQRPQRSSSKVNYCEIIDETDQDLDIQAKNGKSYQRNQELEKVKPRDHGCMSILNFVKSVKCNEKNQIDVSKKRKSDVVASSSLCPPKQARINEIPETVECSGVNLIEQFDNSNTFELEKHGNQDKEKTWPSLTKNDEFCLYLEEGGSSVSGSNTDTFPCNTTLETSESFLGDIRGTQGLRRNKNVDFECFGHQLEASIILEETNKRVRHAEPIAGDNNAEDVYEMLKSMEECFRRGRKLADQLLNHAMKNEGNNSPLSIYVVHRTITKEHKAMDELLLAHRNLKGKVNEDQPSSVPNPDNIQVVP